MNPNQASHSPAGTDPAEWKSEPASRENAAGPGAVQCEADCDRERFEAGRPPASGGRSSVAFPPVVSAGVESGPMAATNPGVREAPPYVVSISTSMRCAAAPGEVWSQLMFYEEIRRRPPLLLRLFLPTPIRTDGRKSVIGDQVKCHYTTGYLLKRVTRLVRERVYAFEVIEQNFRLAGGIELLGGSYSLRDLSRAGTEIVLETRYRQVDRSGWARRWIEAAVCHQFHRHILKAMCGDIRTRRIEGRSHEVCA